jgi:hypothetical protein
MYLCICNKITEKDLEDQPLLWNIVGMCCGKCISDGAEPDFDGVCETIVDNAGDSE